MSAKLKFIGAWVIGAAVFLAATVSVLEIVGWMVTPSVGAAEIESALSNPEKVCINKQTLYCIKVPDQDNACIPMMYVLDKDGKPVPCER